MKSHHFQRSYSQQSISYTRRRPRIRDKVKKDENFNSKILDSEFKNSITNNFNTTSKSPLRLARSPSAPKISPKGSNFQTPFSHRNHFLDIKQNNTTINKSNSHQNFFFRDSSLKKLQLKNQSSIKKIEIFQNVNNGTISNKKFPLEENQKKTQLNEKENDIWSQEFTKETQERSRLIQNSNQNHIIPSLNPRTKKQLQKNFKDYKKIEKEKPENYYINREFGMTGDIFRGSNPLQRTFGSPLNNIKETCSRGLSNGIRRHSKNPDQKVKAVLLNNEDESDDIGNFCIKDKKEKIWMRRDLSLGNFDLMRNSGLRRGSNKTRDFDLNDTVKKSRDRRIASRRRKKRNEGSKIVDSGCSTNRDDYSSQQIERFSLRNYNDKRKFNEGKFEVKGEIITLDKTSINVLFLVYSKDNNTKKAMNFLENKSVNADIDCVGGDGWGAIHYACLNKNLKYVQKLIFKGCDVDLRGKGGVTALFLAILG